MLLSLLFVSFFLLECFFFRNLLLFLCLVPQDCSGPLQRIVEALFITHAETKLNTMGHLDGSVANSNYHSNLHGMTRERIIADRGNWCRNLIRRPN